MEWFFPTLNELYSVVMYKYCTLDKVYTSRGDRAERRDF